MAELRARVGAWRAADEAGGLVPTMGALHEGHLALVRAAKAECARTVVTIFVNPAQFGPNEDFAKYPRDEARDLALLDAAGADLAYLPDAAAMYPPGFTTTVSVAPLSQTLCGPHRPGHFAGVATVVAKLLIQAAPDAAFFGEKDYQQLTIVRRLAKDLDLPVRIIGVPTVREPDGLALSSRNAYLSAAERRAAPALFRAICAVAANPTADQVARAKDDLVRAGFGKIDYLTIADAETLQPAADPGRPARVFAAAWLGRTRLIDNVPVARR
jgi:pantoate--beta-alanine ligase